MHEMQAKSRAHLQLALFQHPGSRKRAFEALRQDQQTYSIRDCSIPDFLRRAALLKEAGLKPETGGRSWDDIPRMLKALRQRAAKHMNNVMEHLQTVQTPGLKPKTLLELIATVFEAIPPAVQANSHGSNSNHAHLALLSQRLPRRHQERAIFRCPKDTRRARDHPV